MARMRQQDMVVDQFTRQAEGYARLVEGYRRRGRPPAFAPIAPAADDIALDVACGSGSMTLALAAEVAHVTGIDLTAAMVAQGRALAAAAGIDNVAWQLGDVAALPFADGSFSLVTCSAAFHHLDRPLDVLREMARVTRADGRIAIVDLTPDPAMVAAFDRLERLRDPSHTHANTIAEFEALGAAAGLALVGRETYATAIPFDAVLATSHPTEIGIDAIRALLAADADAGTDSQGFGAHHADGVLMARYPMTAFVWRR